MKLIFTCLLLCVVVSVNGKFTAKDCREKMAKDTNAALGVPDYTTPDEREYYRKLMYKDGRCDQELNNAECGYDGGDCCLNFCDSNMVVSKVFVVLFFRYAVNIGAKIAFLFQRILLERNVNVKDTIAKRKVLPRNLATENVILN